MSSVPRLADNACSDCSADGLDIINGLQKYIRTVCSVRDNSGFIQTHSDTRVTALAEILEEIQRL